MDRHLGTAEKMVLPCIITILVPLGGLVVGSLASAFRCAGSCLLSQESWWITHVSRQSPSLLHLVDPFFSVPLASLFLGLFAPDGRIPEHSPAEPAQQGQLASFLFRFPSFFSNPSSSSLSLAADFPLCLTTPWGSRHSMRT
ncbi:hypothetical protein BJX66DRAFT_204812 [Aspergillus keveii]|uniref:Uncharacterized protein n=1 Tax=Aspergillus keveii TaxID=714993 RepID=A0ABR4G520_9EURO